MCLGFVGLASDGPNLQSSRITREYKDILEAALRAVGVLLAARALPHIAAQVAYLQFQFNNGAANAGRITALGLQTVRRQSRDNLLLAWNSIRSWEQLLPASMRTPVPHMVVAAPFGFAIALRFRPQGPFILGSVLCASASVCFSQGSGQLLTLIISFFRHTNFQLRT